MTTKLDKLFAAYARFAEALIAIPDAKTQDLRRIATGVPQFVADVRQRLLKTTTSQITSGLEQGLREMPDIIGEIDAQWRWAVSIALHEAIAAEYPELLARDADRLKRILARGKIRTEAEFHLVRHQIDILESAPELSANLRNFYALVEAYETHA